MRAVCKSLLERSLFDLKATHIESNSGDWPSATNLMEASVDWPSANSHYGARVVISRRRIHLIEQELWLATS
jgi:hypothetical protein